MNINQPEADRMSRCGVADHYLIFDCVASAPTLARGVGRGAS